MKKLQGLSKNAEIHDGKKVENHSIATRNYAGIYHQTFLSNSWGDFLAPKAKNSKNDKNFQKKPEKNCKN